MSGSLKAITAEVAVRFTNAARTVCILACSTVLLTRVVIVENDT